MSSRGSHLGYDIGEHDLKLHINPSVILPVTYNMLHTICYTSCYSRTHDCSSYIVYVGLLEGETEASIEKKKK